LRVITAAVVESAYFVAYFIYLNFVLGRTLRRQFGSLAMLAHLKDCRWLVDTIQTLVVLVLKFRIRQWVLWHL
jgi:hypothetical protein